MLSFVFCFFHCWFVTFCYQMWPQSLSLILLHLSSGVLSKPWGGWWGTAGPRAERSCSCGARGCGVVMCCDMLCLRCFDVDVNMWTKITRSTLIKEIQIINLGLQDSKSNLWLISLKLNVSKKQAGSFVGTDSSWGSWEGLVVRTVFCLEWISDSFSIRRVCILHSAVLDRFSLKPVVITGMCKVHGKTWKRQLLAQSCILFELCKKIHEACSLFRL